MKYDIDTGLIVKTLAERGHRVGHVIPVPDNAGEFEFEVDGELLTLSEVRELIEADAPK
jgi:hypothetical protein